MLFFLFNWSFSPFFSVMCFPSAVLPRYFFPDNSLESCLAWTSNDSHASLAVLELKYFPFRQSQTGAASNLVGSFLGSCLRQAASGQGNNTFSNFKSCSSAVVFSFGSDTGLKNHSGIFICINGLAVTFNTALKVSGLAILAKKDMLAV